MKMQLLFILYDCLQRGIMFVFIEKLILFIYFFNVFHRYRIVKDATAAGTQANAKSTQEH
jgi:hypothetical protein